MNIAEALSSGPRTSKEIQAMTGLSQASVSRIVRNDDSILRMPGPQPYRYAATRSAFGSNDQLPIATIDVNGKTVPRAVLTPLRPDGYLAIQLQGASELFAGENLTGHFHSLPYFLDDARPQGFLGKLIAEALAEQSDEFSADLDEWSEEQVGRYLVSNGDNLPGDIVFGIPMMNRIRSRPTVQSRSEYTEIANDTMAGYTGESSAGGKQSKFTAFISDIESHVIVKFTPAQDNLTAQRWRDILVTEFHAQNVLSENGFTAAETLLLEQNGRFFLESKRFDRNGMFGRSSIFSMRTIDAEFTGVGGNWTDVARALYESQYMSLSDSSRVADLELFGRLINNTDMHLGNLSLAIDGNRFSLLPVYDMCSMGFSPKGTEVEELRFRFLEKINDVEPGKYEHVLKAAAEFWRKVENDPRASSELQKFLKLKQPAQIIEAQIK